MKAAQRFGGFVTVDEQAAIKKSIANPKRFCTTRGISPDAGWLCGGKEKNSLAATVHRRRHSHRVQRLCPMKHADAYTLSEFYGSARQVARQPDGGRQSQLGHATPGYWEADWLGTGHHVQ